MQFVSSQLIAFTGLATSGKSTAADHLTHRHGHTRLSFAGPIRQMLKCLGLTAEDLQKFKETPHPLLDGKTPRWAMQSLGTQWGRESISPGLWVNAARHWIDVERKAGRPVVFDDCRFDNEARTVRDLGGIVIEITRPGLVRGTHESERGVSPDLVNFSIPNTGTVSELTSALDRLLSLPA